MFSQRTNWELAHNRFTQAMQDVRAAGVPVLDLTVSNPTRVGLRYDEEAIVAALSSPQLLDYDPQPKGLRQARNAVVAYYADAHALPGLDPEQLVLTSSTSEGYSYVLRLLCNPGDELLVPQPSYPLFEFLADLQDVKLLPYPLIYDHGWQMDFHSMRKVISPRTRGAVVVHPNNPTGSYVQPHEIGQLNSFCREFGLALIADEVFLDFAHDGKSRASFAANRDVLTFTLSGVSKISGLPQMKLSWVATSGPRAQVAAAVARLEVVADTYLSMSAPIQWAAPVLLNQRTSIQTQIMDRVLANLEELDRQLALQNTCQRLMVESGWYAILRVPVTKSDEELAIELLRRRSVLVHPGHFFDFPKDGYLVLSLITPAEEFSEGTRRLVEWVDRAKENEL